MLADGHDQHLVPDAAIEALDQAVGLGRVRFSFTMVGAQFAADRLEAVSLEAAAATGQYMGHLEGEGRGRSLRMAVAQASVSSSLTAR